MRRFHGDAEVAEFDEPGGLTYADDKLYVADTNNHVIRVIDLDTEMVDTLEFSNPESLVVDITEITILGSNASDNTSVTLDEQTLLMGDGDVTLTISLPDNYKINDLIDSRLSLTSKSNAVVVNQESDDNTTTVMVDNPSVTIPVTLAVGKGELVADLTLYYCREGEEALCFIDTVTYVAPVTVVEGGDDLTTTITLEREVLPPSDF